MKKSILCYFLSHFWLFFLTGLAPAQGQSATNDSQASDSLYHERKRDKASKEIEQSADKLTRNTPSRWQLAGNVSVQPKPFFINASPLAGYRFNQHWIAGLGPTYIYHREGLFSPAAPSKGLPMHVYGGRVFVSRRLYKPLFAQVETEALNYPYFVSPSVPSGSGETRARRWVVNPLAGLSFNQALSGKSFFQLSVLYNFNYHNDPFNQQLYNSPWIFRLGAGIGNGKK